MDESAFRQLVTETLCPLLGAKLEPESLSSTTQEHEASILKEGGGRSLALKPSRDKPYRLRVTRSQRFTAAERGIAQAFCEEVGRISERDLPEEYREELIRGVSSRIVAKHFSEVEGTLRSILHQFDLWASQTYEGRRIAAAVGVSPEVGDESSSTLPEFWQQPFAPVLTNGYDTLLVATTNNRVARFEQLGLQQEESPFAPYRLQALVDWTTDDKIVAVLNQHGETLIFADQELRFAKRRGVWSHYYLESVTKRLSPPKSVALRKALLESCLDVSFSRSGACIGVVLQARKSECMEKGIISSDDMLSRDMLPEDGSLGYKAKLFAEVTTKPFQELDRRLRQELLAMDGALVLDHRGTLKAISAIVKVPGGSEGGGRTLAARTLGEFGLGIKVSADGPITAYRKKKPDDSEPSLLFSLG